MKLPTALDRFDRALLIRHFSIAIAALAAYLLRHELQAGNSVLWILGVAAALNLTAFFSGRSETGRPVRVASSLVAVLCWSALVHVTGGVASPFTPGFWLEIALSALSLSILETSLVAACTVLALWAQQALLGFPGLMTPLLAQTGFLILAGSVTLLWTHRSIREHRIHSLQRIDLQLRLDALEKELTDVRLLGEVGESAAQLAHGVKNAVHSLRGFVTLIGPKIDRRGAAEEALEGLRCAIDHLEDLARASLRPNPAPQALAARCDGHEAQAAIDASTREMSAAYPEITWERPASSDVPAVAASPTILREVLLILLHNAAEAMGGRGIVRIETLVSDDQLRIRVRDHGCGVPGEQMQKIFDPGYTTKPDGTGLGLYLARKLLEAQGGMVAAERVHEGGALFCVALPVARS